MRRVRVREHQRMGKEKRIKSEELQLYYAS